MLLTPLVAALIREGSDGNTYIVPYERVRHESEGWGTTTDNWTEWFREQVEKDGIFLGHSNAKWFIDLLCGEGSMREAADRINNALNGDRKELRRILGEADEEFYDKALGIPIVGYALAITIGDDIRPGETQRAGIRFGQECVIAGGFAITVGAVIKHGGKLYKLVKNKAGRHVLEEVAPNSVPTPKVLQTGGHTLSDRVRKALNLSKEDAKRAMEGLKRDLGQGASHHQHKIHDNGDVLDSHTGELLGNLFDYL